MLRIAVQSKGRLYDETMELLGEAGIKLTAVKHTLLVPSRNFPVELLFLRDDDIPEKLREQIEESKEKVFKITYKDDEYLYIANGYGKQKSGGYSVTVKEFYKLGNAIYFGY